MAMRAGIWWLCILLLLILLATLPAVSAVAAPPTPVPARDFDTYCNERIGVILFISKSGDIAAVPLKDTKIKTCKDVP